MFLAGLPNAPSLYASSPELALKRTQTVLKRMVKCRVLTQMQADAIAEEAAGLTVSAAARAVLIVHNKTPRPVCCGTDGARYFLRYLVCKGGIMLPIQAVAALPVR